MTKNSKKKQTASAANVARELAPLIAKASIGAAGVSGRGGKGKKEKKGGKKKKGGFARGLGKFLKGAAKIALDVAPVVAPMLLAKHGPTKAALAAAPKGVAAQAAAQGIATPVSIQPQTGMTNIVPIIQNGRIHGVRLTGIDYLGQVSATADVATGELLTSFSLNPTTADWAGTRLQREMSLWERFRYRRLAVMYEPALPTTAPGQVVLFVDTDPDETIEGAGITAVQNATAHAGAEMFQVWEAGCAEYLPDNETQDFYADAEGSDQRLISPGNAFLLASTDIPVATPTTFGALYACYDVELIVPQIEGAFMENSVVFVQGGSVNVYRNTPFGDAPVFSGGRLVCQYTDDSGNGKFYGLNPGTYMCVVSASGASGTPNPINITFGGAYTTAPTLGLTYGQATNSDNTRAMTTQCFTVPASSASNYKSVTWGFMQIAYALGISGAIVIRASITQIPPDPSALSRRVVRKSLQEYEKLIDSLQLRLTRAERLAQSTAAAVSLRRTADSPPHPTTDAGPPSVGVLDAVVPSVAPIPARKRHQQKRPVVPPERPWHTDAYLRAVHNRYISDFGLPSGADASVIRTFSCPCEFWGACEADRYCRVLKRDFAHRRHHLDFSSSSDSSSSSSSSE